MRHDSRGESLSRDRSRRSRRDSRSESPTRDRALRLRREQPRGRRSPSDSGSHAEGERSLWVGGTEGLPRGMSDADLRALFEPFCAVCETVIKQGKASSGTGIYSFVTLFASDDVAETAIRTLAGQPLTSMPGKPNQLKSGRTPPRVNPTCRL